VTEEQAKKLAIDIAFIYPQGYMPENIEEFEPHLWVIRAIQVAYIEGRDSVDSWKS